MTPEQILACPARVLTTEQRELYFERGYLFCERLISDEWVKSLHKRTNDKLEASRGQTESTKFCDLAPEHSSASPKVRRFTDLDRDELFWRFANDAIADVAADLLGPNVTFHHSKLNFKWPTSGESNAVGWHQDIPFYPHTNYNVLAIGTYLEDTTVEHGPLSVIPGSHEGKLYEHYDERDIWIGELNAADAMTVEEHKAVSMPGPRGSITVHHSRMLHGSRPSSATTMRPLLINTYAAGDAFPYTDGGTQGNPNYRRIVRGEPVRWAQHDPRPCPIPPDWTAGYPSIYEQQAAVAEPS